MADRAEHEILVIEHDPNLRKMIEDTLTRAGHQVRCETSSLEALSLLKAREASPFSLVISSFRMPRMEGDQILEKAKLISPLTQRMIIADPSEIETVIGAVNRADVHGCLSIPFTEENLSFQVDQCLRAHLQKRKRANLIKVTERQNRQMYKLAKTFKKRDDDFTVQIEAKKKKIRVLKSRSRSRGGIDSGQPLTLDKVVERHGGEASPDLFAREFQILSDLLLTLLNRACGDHDIKLKAMACDQVTAAPAPSQFRGAMDQVLPLVFAEAMARGPEPVRSEQDQPTGEQLPLTEYLEITISEDRLTAFALIKKWDADLVTVEAVKEALDEQGICAGLKDDAMIKTWLSLATPEGDSFVIAQGIAPEYPVDATVKYHFAVDFRNPGKVLEDGSIDFRDRGDIPFVKAGTLLTEKTAVREGRSGTDVTGLEIPVAEAVEVMFNPGTGTRLSDDGLQIFADADGQPHLDAMGNVSVFSEIKIEGDVDFETGNINFDGNIVVAGVIKEGFSVRGATLTAGQIEGAEIELTGDLNVGAGIIDAKLIRVQGSVQAKYVNNSVIRAFGDLIVQKEIIDSKVLLSGECVNQTGNIIASTIVAKKGVQAVHIGTETSSPTRLRVGVDDHIKSLVAEINAKLKSNKDQIASRKAEIEALEAEDQELHVKISEAAYVQDRFQVELRKIQKQMVTLKESNDLQELGKLSKLVRKIHKEAQAAEQVLDQAFHRQDILVKDIQDRKRRITTLEEGNKALVDEKNALREFSSKTEAMPQVIISKRAMPETLIEGPNSVLRINESISRMRAVEVKRDANGDGGLSFHEMMLMSLS
ncbi:MAG: DUF342 domain-containing protein [Desulfobacteraceae bacterium]|nr:DUF342 domain-containing protein [Desulfobacteraceae bacterium]